MNTHNVQYDNLIYMDAVKEFPYDVNKHVHHLTYLNFFVCENI